MFVMSEGKPEDTNRTEDDKPTVGTVEQQCVCEVSGTARGPGKVVILCSPQLNSRRRTPAHTVHIGFRATIRRSAALAETEFRTCASERNLLRLTPATQQDLAARGVNPR